MSDSKWLYPAIIAFLLLGFTASVYYNGKVKQQLKEEQVQGDALSAAMDTLLLPKIDTVFIYVDKVKWLKPKIKYVGIPEQLPADTAAILSEHIYTDSVADDSITIYYDITTRGELADIYLGYKPKFYRQITKTVVFNTNTPVYVAEPKTYHLWVGGRVGILKPVIQPELQVEFPSCWKLGLGYDFAQGNIQAGIYYRLK
jgi:hypothetical protein